MFCVLHKILATGGLSANKKCITLESSIIVIIIVSFQWYAVVRWVTWLVAAMAKIIPQNHSTAKGKYKFGNVLQAVTFSWWRHQMETFSALLALCAGNTPGTVTRASNAELWCFLWSINGWVNSLWPRDAIRRHRSRSTLAQAMACCLTAPSHYLNQCWFIISKIQLHSSDGNFTGDTPVINE